MQYDYDPSGELFYCFVLTLLLVFLPVTMTRKYRAHLVPTVLAIAFFGHLLRTTEITKETLWNPYSILGVDEQSSTSQIRKAFKKLSLQYHPDKVAANTSEDIFIDISKAYKVLTDEDARKTWDEFGHPDGKQAFQMGVALPTWIIDSKNSNLVLLVYGLLFGVGLPLLVVSSQLI